MKNKKIYFGAILLSAVTVKGIAITTEHIITDHSKEICPITIMALNYNCPNFAESHQSKSIENPNEYAVLGSLGITVFEEKNNDVQIVNYIELPKKPSR